MVEETLLLIHLINKYINKRKNHRFKVYLKINVLCAFLDRSVLRYLTHSHF
jgi:hypothetical protein